MEPRSDERGRPTQRVRVYLHAKLQWSRVRMNAEGTNPRLTNFQISVLQWSRVRMNAEGQSRRDGAAGGDGASMEPRSDERGRHAGHRWRRLDHLASMEPRSDERGRRGVDPRGHRLNFASMEPGSDECERAAERAAPPPRATGFNGAAFG